MEVLVLQAFVSLILVGGSLLLFGHSAHQRDYEHADRLALLPLGDEGVRPHGEPTATDKPTEDSSVPTNENEG